MYIDPSIQIKILDRSSFEMLKIYEIPQLAKLQGRRFCIFLEKILTRSFRRDLGVSVYFDIQH